MLESVTNFFDVKKKNSFIIHHMATSFYIITFNSIFWHEWRWEKNDRKKKVGNQFLQFHLNSNNHIWSLQKRFAEKVFRIFEA